MGKTYSSRLCHGCVTAVRHGHLSVTRFNNDHDFCVEAICCLHKREFTFGRQTTVPLYALYPQHLTFQWKPLVVINILAVKKKREKKGESCRTERASSIYIRLKLSTESQGRRFLCSQKGIKEVSINQRTETI